MKLYVTKVAEDPDNERGGGILLQLIDWLDFKNVGSNLIVFFVPGSSG
jgi:hypothetical protein